MDKKERKASFLGFSGEFKVREGWNVYKPPKIENRTFQVALNSMPPIL
ncbi:hypothetical protein [Thermococcus sp. P6]|nr:hypothetical protein [Thermococcus sp. P6]